MATEFGKLLADVMESMLSGTQRERWKALINIYGYHMTLQARIAELASELVTTKQKLTDCEARNAELEKSGDDLAEELSDMEIAKDDVFDEAWKLKAKVVELETLVEKLIEVGDWAITGMAIATSYSSSKMNDLAERRRDEWCALIKKWAESEK